MRRKDREITDQQQILSLLDKTRFLHLGLFDGDYPYIVPLHYGYTWDEADRQLTFYMHCAKEGHKLELIAANPHAFVELENDVELVSGGDVACRYGSYYTSLMARGMAHILPPGKEKEQALEILMKHQTGRDFVITSAMAESVAVIKFTAQDFTAKARVKK